tara:strand:+ start:66 stop:878 length:813 start_codon:yes stop_codon:yes gene_type:complete
MLLTSVIIIIREVLEAAFLISILLSLCVQLNLTRHWFKWSLAGGVAGSIALGSQFGWVSNLFGGIGQELVDAGLQVFIYLCLLYICFKFIDHYFKPSASNATFRAILTAVIACAMTREGSEIYIYLLAFQDLPEGGISLYSGSIIGFGIGLSCCALFYYWILSFSVSRSLLLGCVLLTTMASGMMLQAAKMLIQADLLPDGQLWDSNGLLAEESLAGQLLYALVGYEATPAPAQLMIYMASGLTMAGVMIARHQYWRHRQLPKEANQYGN